MRVLGPSQDTAAGPRPTDREPENVPLAYPLGTTVLSSTHGSWGQAVTPRQWAMGAQQEPAGERAGGYGAWATVGRLDPRGCGLQTQPAILATASLGLSHAQVAQGHCLPGSPLPRVTPSSPCQFPFPVSQASRFLHRLCPLPGTPFSYSGDSIHLTAHSDPPALLTFIQSFDKRILSS